MKVVVSGLGPQCQRPSWSAPAPLACDPCSRRLSPLSCPRCPSTWLMPATASSSSLTHSARLPWHTPLSSCCCLGPPSHWTPPLLPLLPLLGPSPGRVCPPRCVSTPSADSCRPLCCKWRLGHRTTWTTPPGWGDTEPAERSCSGQRRSIWPSGASGNTGTSGRFPT